MFIRFTTYSSKIVLIQSVISHLFDNQDFVGSESLWIFFCLQVGIDEDVLSTGITLYHLKEGKTKIGSDEEGPGTHPDITLRGPCIIRNHCVIDLKDGSATLIPRSGALCSVNAVQVTQPTRLSQGCVVVLGKTNMFRYNDPTEAASMRLTMSMSSSR